MATTVVRTIPPHAVQDISDGLSDASYTVEVTFPPGAYVMLWETDSALANPETLKIGGHALNWSWPRTSKKSSGNVWYVRNLTDSNVSMAITAV